MSSESPSRRELATTGLANLGVLLFGLALGLGAAGMTLLNAMDPLMVGAELADSFTALERWTYLALAASLVSLGLAAGLERA